MRRSMSMVAVLALVTACSLASATPSARAFEVWCDNDPTVQINGVTVNITVSVWLSALHNIAGSVPVVIIVPDGSTTSIVSSGAGQQFSENVQFIPVSQSARAEALLGLSRGDIDFALGNDAGNGRGNHVTVLSVVPSIGLTSFGTRLSTSRSQQVSVAQSNQWMSVGFELSGKN